MKTTSNRTVQRVANTAATDQAASAKITASSDEGIRLSKTVAALVGCSRSQAEQYIENGHVRVNGLVVTSPQFRVRNEKVTLEENAELSDEPLMTLIYHKLAGKNFGADNQGSLPGTVALEITADSRAANDPRNIELLPRHLAHLTVPCPMEPAMSGLAVLTQDGRIARKLMDDAKTLEQEIIVEVKEDASALSANGLRQLGHGLSFQGKPLPPCKVSWQNERRLRFAIKWPRPGQLTHMCQQVGLTVVSMKRIRIGRLPMAGLAVGQWRFLLDNERF